MHGISLNVNCDLSHYNSIIPCGIEIEGRHVCSMLQLSDANQFQDLRIEEVAKNWLQHILQVFQLQEDCVHNQSEYLDDLVESSEVRNMKLQYILSRS